MSIARAVSFLINRDKIVASERVFATSLEDNAARVVTALHRYKIVMVSEIAQVSAITVEDAFPVITKLVSEGKVQVFEMKNRTGEKFLCLNELIA